jgi:hypothetical protein
MRTVRNELVVELMERFHRRLVVKVAMVFLVGKGLFHNPEEKQAECVRSVQASTNRDREHDFASLFFPQHLHGHLSSHFQFPLVLIISSGVP